MGLTFGSVLLNDSGARLLMLGAGLIASAVGIFWLRRALSIEPDVGSFRATAADPGFRRTVRLGAALLVAAGAVVAWFLLVPQACFVGSRPPALNDPWYSVFVARPALVIAPALVFLVGGYIALGARAVAWQVVGLGLSGIAAAVAFLISAAVLPICT